jgi:pimeloyl-CoA dehydrogenase small subunit
MDFDLSEEQRLLEETVRRLVDTEYDFAKRKAYLAEPDGWSRKQWAAYAELGLLGLPLPEAYGGIGGSAIEVMIVMEAMGRGLVLEPYLETVVLGGGLVSLAGSEAQKQAILGPLAAGKLLLAFAHGEPRARYDLAHVETRATRDGGGYVLNGRKAVVLHGECADKLIVSARTAGARSEHNGISLFLVDRRAPNVSVRGYGTNDDRRAADIALENVRVPADALLGAADAALPVIEHAVDRAIAALAAEAVGAIEKLNAMTLDYIKTRKQFGVAIGSFQVLQHRMVDMTIEHEQARSMAILAALAADDPDRAARRKAIAAAKVRIGRSGQFVGEGAIQLHGGIGMTHEYAAGHYFKRLAMIDATFGDVAHHLDAVAALTLRAE